jgi:hypothetical protein
MQEKNGDETHPRFNKFSLLQGGDTSFWVGHSDTIFIKSYKIVRNVGTLSVSFVNIRFTCRPSHEYILCPQKENVDLKESPTRLSVVKVVVLTIFAFVLNYKTK